MAESGEFELLGRMTIGQYLPTGSPLHTIDPRGKLFVGVLLVLTTVATGSLLGLTLLLITVVAGFLLARIALRYALSGLRPLLPFILILALLQVFTIPQRGAASVLWHWGPLIITDASLLAGITLIGRVFAMVLTLSLLSFTTTTTELTHGIEHLLLPLQAFRFPAHELALVAIIAVRFLPILAQETERLMKAQASRGADFGRGRGNPIRRTRRLLPLVVPLFLVSLQRAEDLVLAMEARCYTGGRGRTHLIQLKARHRDYAFVAALVGIAVLAVTLSVISADHCVQGWLAGML